MPSDHSTQRRGGPVHSSGRHRRQASAPATASTSTAPIQAPRPLGTTCSEPAIHTSHVASSRPSGLAKGTPHPGRRANATRASGVAASPSTSISTKKRSAAVIAWRRTLMSPPVVTTFERIADLPLTVEGYSLEGRERRISAEFERLTTTFHLQGGGEEGLGEDVTYDPEEHREQQARGPTLPLAGEWTFGEFARHAGELDLFPAGAPQMPAFLLYRRWAVESAGLDLALRQAGRSLGDVMGREHRPVSFVVSLRLGSPPSFEP